MRHIEINWTDFFSDCQKYAINEMGFGYYFTNNTKHLLVYVVEKGSWAYYNGSRWIKDTISQYPKRALKAMAIHLKEMRTPFDAELKKISAAMFNVDYTGAITDAGLSPQEMSQLRERKQKIEGAEKNWKKWIVALQSSTGRKKLLSDIIDNHTKYNNEFDKDAMIFNTKNRTFDLRKKIHHEQCYDDYLFQQANVEYNPHAICVRWNIFISEITCGDTELARYLQKALGYSLSGSTKEECFFLLYGPTTRNGKGTLMETVMHVMGTYAGVLGYSLIMLQKSNPGDGPSPEKASLFGKRLMYISELPKNMPLDSNAIKGMTGSDTIKGRHLHEDLMEFLPTFKMWISVNSLPDAKDDTIFTSNRAHVIPFNKHFSPSEQDKNLKEFFRQPENMSGIFNWLLEGFKMYCDEGLEMPKSAQKAVKDFREHSDTMQSFINDELHYDENYQTPLQSAYGRYKVWSGDNGYTAMGKKKFAMALRDKGIKVEKNTRNNVVVFGYSIAGEGMDY